MLQVLIFTALLLKPAQSQIFGYGNLTADYGGEAHYTCAVANPTGVLQVTWQRHFKDESVENLATYNKRFGQQVNEPYQGKVFFAEASLSSTSIILKNVTWEDDSCYICSFNVYPDGSKRKQTCLTVQGISEVKTAVQGPGTKHEDVEEVMFSCSATGKPPPTIQWAFSDGASALSQPPTTTVTNSDYTFTSSRNISLQVPADWSGDVDCLLNSGMMGQRQERIPFSLGPGRKKKGEGKRLSALGVALLICAALLVSCIAVVAVIRRKRLKGRRRNEIVS